MGASSATNAVGGAEASYIENCHLTGITSGMQVKGTVYSKNNLFRSIAHHGGVYIGANGCFNDEGSTFECLPKRENYTAARQGSSYFSYRSVSYINGASFLGGTFSVSNNIPGGGIVYISNSTVTKFRVDPAEGTPPRPESELYIGENVSYASIGGNSRGIGKVENTGESYSRPYPGIRQPTVDDLLGHMLDMRGILTRSSLLSGSKLPINAGTSLETMLRLLTVGNSPESHPDKDQQAADAYRALIAAGRNATAVTFPDGVTRIGPYLFYSWSSLLLEALPESIQRIDTGAFYSAAKVTLRVLPANLNYIGSGAFRNCTGLTSITFRSTPGTISANAFQGCTNLLTVNVPWAEGEVAGAPWGAENAQITYNYEEESL